MSVQGAEDRAREIRDRAQQAEDRDALALLEEACDGELSPERIQRMLDHLGDCPECAQEVERLRQMKKLVRRSCRSDTAPVSLRERISIEYRRVSVTETGPDGVRRTTTATTRIRRP